MSTRTQHLTIKPFLNLTRTLFAAVVLALASQAQAQVLTEFTLDHNNSTIKNFSNNLDRLSKTNFEGIFFSSDPFISDPSYNYSYTTQFFTPSKTGTYTFGQSSSPVDTVMLVYKVAFDPNNPGTNLISFNDDYEKQIASVSSFDPGDPLDPLDLGDLDALPIALDSCGSGADLCPIVGVELTQGQQYHVVISTYNPAAAVTLPHSFFVYGPGGVLVGDETNDPWPELTLLLPNFGATPPTTGSPNLSCEGALVALCRSFTNPNTGAFETQLTLGNAQFTLIDNSPTGNASLIHRVQTSTNGETITTQATSLLAGMSSRLQRAGAFSRLQRSSDEQTRVNTSGTVDTPNGPVEVSVIADSAGNSEQSVRLPDGRTSSAELNFPGAQSTIDEDGNIVTNAEFDGTVEQVDGSLEGLFRVSVTTGVDGSGETAFEYFNEVTGQWERISSTLDDGLSDNRFEPGHRVVINEEGGSLSVSIRTSITQDMQF